MVRYLKYEGKNLPVRLRYRVFKALREKFAGASLEKFTGLDPEVLENMLYYGLVSGHKFVEKEIKAKGESSPPFLFKIEDMEDILDECMNEFLELIPEFFPEAKIKNLPKGNELPNLEKENEKQAVNQKTEI